MPVLPNARHERFAQELAKGLTQEKAYEAAGYKPSRFEASKLAAKPHISQRLAEIQERGAIRAEITVADLTTKLMGFAEKLEQASMSGEGETSGVSHQHLNTARQCLMDVGKLNGLIVDKSAQAQVSIEQLLKELDGDA